jgi:hypothetical protein
MAKVTRVTYLPYYPVFALLAIVIAIGWNFVVKAANDRGPLRMLCPEARAAAKLVRVTNSDGSLSSGGKLQGWSYAVCFGVHGAFWMVGCMAITMAVVRIWPEKDGLDRQGQKRIARKPATTDDLA